MNPRCGQTDAWKTSPADFGKALVARPGESQSAFEAQEDCEAKNLFEPMPEGAKLCGSCTGYGSCGNKKYYMGPDGKVVGICNNPYRK
ncbi:MAG: hypothetical protein IKE61_04310 [Coriobacteriales bacterium]|nr:hypothetical protein [Coriobacteriales bacterium]